MRRKLLAMNLVLLVAAAAGAWRFRVEYRLARERYRVLQTPKASGPAGPPAPAPAAPPVQPAAFLDAAQKYLFSPDRNPTVVVEPPKIKPRPKLPQLFGVMNVGTPIAIMATEANAQHKVVRVGDRIGEFKLLGTGVDQITLEWEGERIQAQVSDILVRPKPEAVNPPGGITVTPAQTSSTGDKSATILNSPPNRPGEYQIGAPIQGGPGTTYYALPGDTAPAGTLYQGKRKVIRQTPFGQQAWWEDVK